MYRIATHAQKIKGYHLVKLLQLMFICATNKITIHFLLDIIL